MAPTMEQLSRHVTDWRASILDKGLKVNAGNTKLMVGISGGKMIVKLWKVALIAQYVKKLIHKRLRVVCIVTCRG